MSGQFKLETKLYLYADIDDSDTTLLVVPGAGVRTPINLPAAITIEDGTNTENATVTANTADSLTVTRGGTSYAFSRGALIRFPTITLNWPDEDGQLALTSDITGGAGGDVSRSGSSTDNHIVRWNGTGPSVQDSSATIDDSGNMHVTGSLDVDIDLNVDGDAVVDGEVSFHGGIDLYSALSNISSSLAALADQAFIMVSHVGGDFGHERVLAVTSPLTLTDGGANGSITVAFDSSATLDNNARVGVRLDNTGTPTKRRTIDFVQGDNIGIAVTDDSGSEENDVSIRAYPAGNAKLVQYRDATASPAKFAAAANVSIESDNLALATVSAPTGVSGKVIPFSLKKALELLAFKGPDEAAQYLQPGMFGGPKWGFWFVNGTSTVVDTLGLAATGASGTLPALGTSDLHDSSVKLRMTTSSSANSSQNIRSTVQRYWRGSAAGLGGFFFWARFALDTTSSAMHWLCGLVSRTTDIPSNADPSALTDFFAIAADTGDSNLQAMTNDNSGSATKSDLGSSYPKNTTDAMYDVFVYGKTGDGNIFYEVDRLDSAASTGTVEVTSDLVRNTIFLAPQLAISNRGTGTPGAVAWDFLGAAFCTFT